MDRSRTMRWAVLGAATALAAGLSVGLGPDPVPSADAAGVSAASPDQRVDRRGDPRDHKFLKTRSGRIIHWSHCRQVNVRVNYDHAPRRSRWHVKEAVRRLNRATRLHYRYMGRTNVRPALTGDNYPRGTKLVIGWARPSNSPLKPGTAGVGGPTYRAPAGAIVRGFVIINYRVKMAPGFGKGPRHGVAGTRGQVLMHELAHTVGLAHVGAEAQIMYSQATRKKATWGAGDWRGLRKQGRRAGCR